MILAIFLKSHETFWLCDLLGCFDQLDSLFAPVFLGGQSIDLEVFWNSRRAASLRTNNNNINQRIDFVPKYTMVARKIWDMERDIMFQQCGADGNLEEQLPPPRKNIHDHMPSRYNTSKLFACQSTKLPKGLCNNAGQGASVGANKPNLYFQESFQR